MTVTSSPYCLRPLSADTSADFSGLQPAGDPRVTTWALESTTDQPTTIGAIQTAHLGGTSFIVAWDLPTEKIDRSSVVDVGEELLAKLFVDKQAETLIHYGQAEDFVDIDWARSFGFVFEGVERRLIDGERIDLWRSSRLGTDTAPSAGGEVTAGVINGSVPSHLVAQFHRVYEVPNLVEERAAATVAYPRIDMRMSLIKEEFAELCGAVYGPEAEKLLLETYATLPDQGQRDVIESADALADLVYVIYGMALESGINLDAVLAEVHRSNLSKLMPDGSVRRRDDQKILKGPNFSEPNIAAALKNEK